MSMGGACSIEGSSTVVCSCVQKVGEHVALIGGAYQTSYGQPQLTGAVPSQDIPEVSGEHHEVHPGPWLDLSLADKIGIGFEIVHRLGCQSVQVDGVGGGEDPVLRLQSREPA